MSFVKAHVEDQPGLQAQPGLNKFPKSIEFFGLKATSYGKPDLKNSFLPSAKPYGQQEPIHIMVVMMVRTAVRSSGERLYNT